MSSTNLAKWTLGPMLLLPACQLFGGGDGNDKSSIVANGGAGGQSTGGAAAGGSAPAGGAGGASPCSSKAGPPMVALTAPSGVEFCIDRTEVTQGQYAEFLAKVTTKPGSEHTRCPGNTQYEPSLKQKPPDWEPTTCIIGVDYTPDTTPNRPVVCIDWCDAFAYCAWAGKRLCGKIGGGPLALDSSASGGPIQDPSQSQWFFACSQGGKTLYPYGNTYDPQACEGPDVSSDGDGGYLPKKNVGARPGCRGGTAPYSSIVDLSGSVEEYTDECKDDSQGLAKCASRGGAFAVPNPADYLACSGYGSLYVSSTHPTQGFRCCEDVP